MARTLTLPSRHQIADDVPLRLDVAAALAYPDGSMTASGLRREARKGRLSLERTAGKDYTTLGAIAKMRELCRLNPKARDCGCVKHDETAPDASHTKPSGSSATDLSKRAQSAAEMTVAELKSSLSNTSTESTPRWRQKASVSPIRSSLPTS